MHKFGPKSFMETLRESTPLKERSEAGLSAEAGLIGMNRIEPALRAAGLTKIRCEEWKKDQAIFHGNYYDFDLRLVCTDNGSALGVRGLVDIEDDGDYIPMGEDSVKWSEDFIEFFKKFLFKIVRAK